jgi:hypothetical protein
LRILLAWGESMSPAKRDTWRLWLSAIFLALQAACLSVKAQEADEPEDQDRGQKMERRLHLLQLRQLQRQARIRLRTVEVEPLRQRLDRELTQHVNRAAREFELADAQKTKLMLAGRGDIKRACDRGEAIQARLLRAVDDRDEIIRCELETADFENFLQGGVFGRESLFAKTMATTITQEQRENAIDRRKQDELRRREDELAGYRMAVRDAVARLTPALGLSDEQVVKLKKLLSEEIDPPVHSGESDHAYIMYHFAKLPEAKVRPIFNNVQWRLLTTMRPSWDEREWSRRNGAH